MESGIIITKPKAYTSILLGKYYYFFAKCGRWMSKYHWYSRRRIYRMWLSKAFEPFLEIENKPVNKHRLICLLNPDFHWQVLVDRRSWNKVQCVQVGPVSIQSQQNRINPWMFTTIEKNTKSWQQGSNVSINNQREICWTS